MNKSFLWIGSILSLLVLTSCTLSKSVAMQDYRNNEFRFAMKYPTGWIFEQNESDSFLDIHLSNVAALDGPSCQKNYIGLEIQVGLPKDEKQDFTSFVKSQLDRGLGLPGGMLQELKMGGHTVFQTEMSGWDSFCKGRGYMIEQDKSRYIYVFTGSNEMSEKGTEPAVIKGIIASLKLV